MIRSGPYFMSTLNAIYPYPSENLPKECIEKKKPKKKKNKRTSQNKVFNFIVQQ